MRLMFSGLRLRVHAVAKDLDVEVERDIANQPKADDEASLRESTDVASLSVDSAWLTRHSRRRSRESARAQAQMRSPCHSISPKKAA